MYPIVTPIANKPAFITLSCAGIISGGSPADFSVKLSISGTASVSVTATVVDVVGNAVSPQPALSASSTNGAQQAGGSSANQSYPQPCGAGSLPELTPGNPGYGPDFQPQAYVAGLYPTSEVAKVSAVTTGVATVTAQNVGSSLIEWRTASGATGRLVCNCVQ